MSAREEPREKFDRLRARYLAARAAHDARRSELERKYGRLERSWLRAGERSELDRLERAYDREGEKLFAHVQACSPRDWAHGVPASWVRDSLAWEDVVRPLGEPLSVVPPLSWGSTEHKT